MNLLANIIFSHILGDYFFQTRNMALRKGSSTWWAMVHCFICATLVCLFTKFTVPWYLFVFITHFLIDRFSLADQWSQIIGGRILGDFLKYGQNLDLPKANVWDDQHGEQKMNYRILSGAFTALVYLVIDNSAHLMLYWYGYPYFK